MAAVRSASADDVRFKFFALLPSMKHVVKFRGQYSRLGRYDSSVLCGDPCYVPNFAPACVVRSLSAVLFCQTVPQQCPCMAPHGSNMAPT